MYFTPARTLPVFASTTWTTIGSGVPLKSLFGVNFTFPVVGSISYVPTTCPSFIAGALFPIGFPVLGSTICIGFSLEGVTGPAAFMNFKVLSCSNPCNSSEVAASESGITLGM